MPVRSNDFARIVSVVTLHIAMPKDQVIVGGNSEGARSNRELRLFASGFDNLRSGTDFSSARESTFLVSAKCLMRDSETEREFLAVIVSLA